MVSLTCAYNYDLVRMRERYRGAICRLLGKDSSLAANIIKSRDSGILIRVVEESHDSQSFTSLSLRWPTRPPLLESSCFMYKCLTVLFLGALLSASVSSTAEQ